MTTPLTPCQHCHTPTRRATGYCSKDCAVAAGIQRRHAERVAQSTRYFTPAQRAAAVSALYPD